MNHQAFCGEYANESRAGRISFKKRDILRFVKKYTYLNPDDLTKDMIFKIGLQMIDYYDEAISKYSFISELPADKIELPEWIFK